MKVNLGHTGSAMRCCLLLLVLPSLVAADPGWDSSLDALGSCVGGKEKTLRRAILRDAGTSTLRLKKLARQLRRNHLLD
jgi:hypothetical protein